MYKRQGKYRAKRLAAYVVIAVAAGGRKVPQRYTVVLKCLEHPRLCVCLIRLYACLLYTSPEGYGFQEITEEEARQMELPF